MRNVEPVLPGTWHDVRERRAAGDARRRADPGAGRARRARRRNADRRVAAPPRGRQHASTREYDEKTEQWIVKRNGHASSIFAADDARTRIAVPKPNGDKAFEVVGIPLPSPGFYVVELASPQLGAALFGEPKPYYVRTATLVTNLSVHFKLGRESSLVWVTRARRRQAGRQCARSTCATARGTTYWRRHAPTHRASPASTQALPDRDRRCRDCATRRARILRHRAHRRRHGVRVLELGRRHLAVALQRADRQLRAAPISRTRCSTARSLRAGETVSMKLFVRQARPARASRWCRRDALDGHADDPAPGLASKEYTVPVKWTGDRATGEATFAIPKDADARHLQIFVQRHARRRSAETRSERLAGTFRVEAFRVPLMRARLQAVGDAARQPGRRRRSTCRCQLPLRRRRRRPAGEAAHAGRSQGRRVRRLRRLRVRRRRRHGRPRGAGRRDARASTATPSPIPTIRRRRAATRRGATRAATRHRTEPRARRRRRRARDRQGRRQRVRRCRATSSPSSSTAIPTARR